MATTRPNDVQCTKWEPASLGAKACTHYLRPEVEDVNSSSLAPEKRSPRSAGMCALADEFLCVEWVRRHGSEEQKSVLAGRRFAQTTPTRPQGPDPDAPPPLVLAPSVPKAPARLQALLYTPQGALQMAPPRPFEPAKAIATESLEALERAGVEIVLEAPYLDGAITLVPARTGRTDRSELTFREAATLRLIVDAFPGAHVTAYRTGAREQAIAPEATPEVNPLS